MQVSQQIEKLEKELNNKESQLYEMKKSCDEYQKELYAYKKEYNRIMESPSVKALFVLKKLCGRPYSPKYIDEMSALNDMRYIKKRYDRTIKENEKLPTIDVVIPTYRETPYIDECIQSILSQDYDLNKIHIIISVNGKDKDYLNTLKKKYEKNSCIEVIYTEKKGASAARNNAKSYLKNEYTTYLDDDDYFTTGFLKDMASHTGDAVDVVCGRLVDKKEDGSINADTYINRVLKLLGEGLADDYNKAGSLFTSICVKLIRTDIVKNVFSDFNENVPNTEDVIFWVENILNVKMPICLCNFESEEAYVRRITGNSLSRPGLNEEYKFYIEDRLLLYRLLEKHLYGNTPVMYKRFVLNRINSQVSMMRNCYTKLNKSDKKRAYNAIQAENPNFIRMGYFANRTGIAFCHNFSPTADPSAYVATKRLSQISKHIGQPIQWTVVTHDMKDKCSKDLMFETFYSYYQYTERILFDGPTWFNEKTQYEWGKRAFETMENQEVDYIYSRSLWAGSHVAAYLYKQKHPKVKWFAEFSDPVYMGTDNKPRPTAKEYEGDEAFLNTFWKDLETKVFENADQIIFTNPSQKQYMLVKNPPRDIDDTEKRSLVWKHPRMDNSYINLFPYAEELDEEYINIGYFGSFYANRNSNEILKLAKNKRIMLHIFTKINDDIKQQVGKSKNIILHPYVSHFEFLNIANRLDYCVLNDIDFDDEINPFIPSKLADYMTANARIIAIIKEGSELSKYGDKRIIKIKNVTSDFVNSLEKR